MKVMTILGTRPEIIRLRSVIDVLDASCDHLLVHTGQNYDHRLSRLFFDELGLREPDVNMGVRADSFADQVGQIIARAGVLLAEHRPDALLVLGDTNSGLSAVVAKRMGIPVFHMEAGNRCYDDSVPEEVNRRVIDHSSSVLLPYTYGSADNLAREGIERRRVFVTGNPIKEVLDRFADMPVVCSLHPRTADRMRSYGVSVDGVRFVEPLGLFDFVALEKAAFCVLSDSGTVQEECCILGVPTVTLRDVTERPETIECGSNILSGVEPDSVLSCVKLAVRRRGGWTPPPEYLADNVSETVARIIVGHLSADGVE